MNSEQIKTQLENYQKQRQQVVKQLEEASKMALMLDGAIEALGALIAQDEAEKPNDAPLPTN